MALGKVRIIAMLLRMAKKSSTKNAPKKASSKKSVTAVKKAVAKSAAKHVKKATKKTAKKTTAKKAAAKPLNARLEKEALKLVDKASKLLRTGIKNSHKTSCKIREKAQQDAHTMLRQATRHLDDVLKTGSSFLKKAIDKI